MRRGVLIFLIINLVVIGFLVHQVWSLLTLLVVDGQDDAITKAELPAPGSDKISDRDLIIPKIIHQTYKNASIPPVWQEAQESCIDLHKEEDGWEYKLWTDAMAEKFIQAEYPWFYDTFVGYPYPIQRADSIRYFVLAHFGGVYIDLDDGCNRELTPLLSYPAFLRRTLPTGISNDAMGSVPRHPFFMKVIEVIQSYDRSWVLPYITVMGSTGPLFLSVMWVHWIMGDDLNIGDDADGGRVRIIFPEEYNGHPWSFFTHHVGNSWHGADVQLIFWLARNWILVTIIGFIVGISVILLGWWAYRRFALGPSDGSPRSPRWASASLRRRLPFWRRVTGRKEYELLDREERHDA